MKHSNQNKNRQCVFTIIACALVLFSGSFAHAEDIKLNSVNTGSLTTSQSQLAASATGVNPDDGKILMHQFGQAGLANYLPIHTPQLSPGDVAPRTLSNEQMLQPIFLIGSDERSKSWLSQNCTQLKTLHAIGLLIEVSTQDEIEQIQNLGQGLMILPVSPNEVISKYNLQHYPVLITKEGIQQ